MADEDPQIVVLQSLVPIELAQKVKDAAYREERSVSSWVRRVLAKELEQAA